MPIRKNQVWRMKERSLCNSVFVGGAGRHLHCMQLTWICYPIGSSSLLGVTSGCRTMSTVGEWILYAKANKKYVFVWVRRRRGLDDLEGVSQGILRSPFGCL